MVIMTSKCLFQDSNWHVHTSQYLTLHIKKTILCYTRYSMYMTVQYSLYSLLHAVSMSVQICVVCVVYTCTIHTKVHVDCMYTNMCCMKTYIHVHVHCIHTFTLLAA